MRASMLRPCCAAAAVWPFPQHNLLPAFLASVAEHARLTAPGLSAFPHGNPISTIPVAPDANSAARRPMANMAKNEPREGPLAAGEPWDAGGGRGVHTLEQVERAVALQVAAAGFVATQLGVSMVAGS